MPYHVFSYKHQLSQIRSFDALCIFLSQAGDSENFTWRDRKMKGIENFTVLKEVLFRLNGGKTKKKTTQDTPLICLICFHWLRIA